MKRVGFLSLFSALGFAFLYLPILWLVVFSFNENKLVTVWSRFSFKWYVELFNDPQILAAAWVSLRVATVSASIALVLGTMAALALTRLGRFKGRIFFTGLITAPLVIPEVMIGLSLLLLFVALDATFGWPAGRSITTIIIAHATFAIAFVTILVQARLTDFDRSLEEAANDLGSTPAQVFFEITLPLISPALISGWLLAFTLSLDDLVIASFVSGPGSSTLPMVIFSKIRLGVSPDVNALATLMIAVVALGILIAFGQMRRRG